MNGINITDDALKQQHASAIAKGNTFRPKGVSETAARAYLDTDEGVLYWRRVAESAVSGTHSSAIDKRAIDQIRSGRDLPRMVTIGPDEPFVKAVPRGTLPTPYTPFFGKRSEFEKALTEDRAINDAFGLPIRSEAPVYDLSEIRALRPTRVFVSHVAPTSELGGLVTHDGGATQYLIPNRKLFTDPVRVTSIGNDLTLHKDLVVSEGLGVPVGDASAIEATRGMAPELGRGVGLLGAVAVAYDATTTAEHASDLLHQGNTVGAESAVVHFGSGNLGMLGGAALGAEVLGAAGVESGPLDFVVAGVGAVGGAVAGDKLANWYDARQIYNQTGPDGETWHFDPKHSDAGWTREQLNLPGAVPGLPFIPGRPLGVQTVTAGPALAQRLDYQASNTSVALALAHVGKPRDPYTQPARATDTPSFGNPPWQRNAQTGQWQREINYPFVERQPVRPSYLGTASASRAAELNAAAEKTIEANLTNSKRGLAEQYQRVYTQRGWQRYGAMPADVTEALHTPTNVLNASNGHTYTQDKNGQWIAPGALWGVFGANKATGNIKAELDATERMQLADTKVHTPQPSAHAEQARGGIDKNNSASIRVAVDPPLRAERTRPDNTVGATGLPDRSDVRHPEHPQHALYAAFKHWLPEGTSEARLAQATAACYEAGMKKPEDVDHIYSGANGKVLITTNSLFARMAEMDLSRPAPTVQQSMQRMQHYDQQQQQLQQQRQQEAMQRTASRGVSMHH